MSYYLLPTCAKCQCLVDTVEYVDDIAASQLYAIISCHGERLVRIICKDTHVNDGKFNHLVFGDD